MFSSLIGVGRTFLSGRPDKNVWPTLSEIALYISGSADPPYHALNFTPLYFAGLWLAVMTMPPRSLRWAAVKETVCDGVGLFDTIVRNPADFNTSAAARANSRDRNLRS